MWKFFDKIHNQTSKRSGGSRSSRGFTSFLDNSRTVKVALWCLVFILFEWLSSHGHAWREAQGSTMLITFGVIVALLPMYWICAGQSTIKNKVFVVTWGGVFIQLGISYLIFHILDAMPNFTYLQPLCCLPYILAPLLVTALLGPLLGMFSVVAVSMLGCPLISADALEEYWVMSMLSGMLTVLIMNNLRSRSQILRAGFLVGALVLVTSLAFGLIPLTDSYETPHIIGWNVAMAVGVSIVLSVLLGGIFPVIEGIFNILTPISWLEMADMNRPLMKRLQMEAPGTFHHCLMVAQLAEAAAEAIGANPVECRVAAYYHDIGKIKNPQYFIENVRDSENVHDSLTPSMSARIIIGHVSDGLELAKSYNLPQLIIDAIQQHHGQSLAYVFYRKAMDYRKSVLEKVEQGLATMDDVPEVVESNFRYPGPRPQSKEVGIVSLADVVESATRSLGNTTLEDMAKMVDSVIKKRVVEGHLDDCELTLHDVKRIQESFLNSLKNIHHQRIAYPKDEEEAKPKPEVSPTASQSIKVETPLPKSLTELSVQPVAPFLGEEEKPKPTATQPIPKTIQEIVEQKQKDGTI